LISELCGTRSGRYLIHFRADAVVFLLWLIFAGASGVFAQVTPARIENADKEPQNWLTFYGNYKAWSYSQLSQITRSNVRQLVPAWAFATGAQSGLESAPLVADGVLYLVDGNGSLFALDAATGKQRWVHKGSRPGRFRGIAMGYGLIFTGTRDNHVIAVDAETGREVWNVEVEDTNKCGCYVQSAPILVKDKLLFGINAGMSAHRGYLSALDAKTGKLAWRFYTIPAPGEPGSETWPAGSDSWKVGGGSTWLPGSYDPDLNLIFWGVSTPSEAFLGEHRHGSDLYTDSLLALDADTGGLKWYFQETPHDIYDFDSNPEPVLIDSEQNGHKRKLILHSSKNGFAYLLNRESGSFILGFPYVSKITWTKGLDKSGKPIAPVGLERSPDYLFCPGATGGHARTHSAYSPRTGWWYSTSLELCGLVTPKNQEPPKEGVGWTAGDFEIKRNPDASPHISAFDPLTGKEQWRFATKYPNNSSLLATAADLIFGGDVTGDAFALDAKTGEKLWSFNTGSRIASPPISFSVNGRQYIAISSGGGVVAEGFTLALWSEAKNEFPPIASTLFVFALPERKTRE
jgi:alcohol dehydrogenase (cytochrome c)